MDAMKRLLATQVNARSSLDHVRAVDNLFDTLKKRHVPALLNQVDHTIGFKTDMPVVIRALELIGFHREHKSDSECVLRNDDMQVRVFEPREDWHPILQVL